MQESCIKPESNILVALSPISSRDSSSPFVVDDNFKEDDTIKPERQYGATPSLTIFLVTTLVPMHKYVFGFTDAD
jgi:hypothetical protein